MAADASPSNPQSYFGKKKGREGFGGELVRVLLVTGHKRTLFYVRESSDGGRVQAEPGGLWTAAVGRRRIRRRRQCRLAGGDYVGWQLVVGGDA